MDEDGFLPMISVSARRGGEATVSRLTELQSPDATQGRAEFLFDEDEEEQQPDRDQSRTAEPDLEDLGLEDLVGEKNETFAKEVEDYGSGSQEEKESSEEQEKEVLEPRRSEEKEKTKNESELKMRNDSQFEDVEEDGKKTWYFWK